MGCACALAACAGAAVQAPTADARAGRLHVTAHPRLIGRFATDKPDYVVRCAPGRRVRLKVHAPAGLRVSVDGRRSRTGGFKASVELASGQGFRLVAKRHGHLRRYSVRCLPQDFPGFAAKRTGHPEAAGYVVAPTFSLGGVFRRYVAIFDSFGVPVWWFDAGGPALNASLLPNGHLLWSSGLFTQLGVGLRTGAYEEHRLDGTIRRSFLAAGGAPVEHHDLRVLANGNYLASVLSPRDGVDLRPYGGPEDATVLDAVVQELTPDGRLLWSWNSKDHVALEETGRWYPSQLSAPVKLPDGRSAYDIVHLNAIEPYDRNHVLISLRHTDALYLLDKRTGAVVWKLAGTPTPQSLTIKGDRGRPDFGGQHDVQRLADGTITVHDNGTGRDRPPRALRFKIRAKDRTATLLEDVRDSAARESVCCGSARRLAHGHWVVSWGGLPLVTELTPTGRRAFSLRFGQKLMSYRAFPIRRGQLRRAALRAGMDRMHPRPR